MCYHLQMGAVEREESKRKGNTIGQNIIKK